MPVRTEGVQFAPPGAPGRSFAPGPGLASPIPEEFQDRIDLSAPDDANGVMIAGRFGDNCVLVRDRRYMREGKLVIAAKPSRGTNGRDTVLKDVTIQIGRFLGDIKLTVTGDDCRLTIGYCALFHGSIALGYDSVIEIGDDTTAGRVKILTAHSDVMIGRDCMISAEVTVNAAMHHGLVDLSGPVPELVVGRRSLGIGDHVWVGQQAALLGDCQIGAGSIVGAFAVVAGTMPGNSAIIGNPARVQRSDVTWNRKLDRIDRKTAQYLGLAQDAFSTPKAASQSRAQPVTNEDGAS